MSVFFEIVKLPVKVHGEDTLSRHESGATEVRSQLSVRSEFRGLIISRSFRLWVTIVKLTAVEIYLTSLDVLENSNFVKGGMVGRHAPSEVCSWLLNLPLDPCMGSS